MPFVGGSVVSVAFDTPENPYLPHDVLWRQKEQFSDGVGYNWIDSLRENAEQRVSDRQFEQVMNDPVSLWPVQIGGLQILQGSRMVNYSVAAVFRSTRH